MTKSQPWEVGCPTHPNEARKLFLLHLLGLGVWLFRVCSYCSIIKRPLSLIVMQFRGMQPPHLFSEISYHSPSWFTSIFCCKHISVFSINEMKHYFCCIFLYMVISVFCCIPVSRSINFNKKFLCGVSFLGILLFFSFLKFEFSDLWGLSSKIHFNFLDLGDLLPRSGSNDPVT